MFTYDHVVDDNGVDLESISRNCVFRDDLQEIHTHTHTHTPSHTLVGLASLFAEHLIGCSAIRSVSIHARIHTHTYTRLALDGDRRDPDVRLGSVLL
jgi:hypothetical protein